ncbi:hypothetical protein B0H14DRAFT_2755902 [Mycena olivaceomarginata]|nr:hypothetical protein B0H14DRAFT_2755902 [Mycena olivaceomarginata]
MGRVVPFFTARFLLMTGISTHPNKVIRIYRHMAQIIDPGTCILPSVVKFDILVQFCRGGVFGRDKEPLDQFKLLSSNHNCEPEYRSQGSNCCCGLPTSPKCP